MLRRFCLLLCAVLCFLLAVRTIVDFDVWYDLRMGEFISHHLWVPHHETFLWTDPPQTSPWFANDEWGFSVADYAVYRLLGENGLSYWMALLVTLALALAAACARLQGASWPAVVAASTLGIWVMQMRLMPRPQLITDVMLAAYLVVSQLPRSRWWLYPLLMLVWCNMHAGCFIGLVFLGALLISDFLETRQWKTTALAMATAFAATAFCPAGLGLFKYFLDHLFVHNLHMHLVEEWRNLTLANNPPSWFLAADLGALLLLAVARKLRALHVMLFGLFTYIAWSHGRFVSELVVTNLPHLALGVEVALRPARRLWERRPLLAEVTAAVVLCGGLLWAVGRIHLVHERALYPDGAIAWLRQHQPPTQIFTSYHFGGYMVWAATPEYKPFIHGLTPTYPDALLLDYVDVSMGGEPAHKVLDRWGVQCMVVGYGLSRGDITEHLLNWLQKDAAWKLVYWDDSALIYVRRSLPFAAYERVRPGDPASWSRSDPDVLDELQRAARETPSVHSLVWLGDALAARHQTTAARRAYLDAILLDAGNAWPHARLGQMLQAGGQTAQALVELKRAYDAAPSAPDAYNVALMHARLGNVAEARRWALTAVRLDKTFEPAQKLAGSIP